MAVYAKEEVFLLEASPYNISGAALTTVRLSSGATQNTFNGNVYLPRISMALNYSAEIFPENNPGASSVGAGNIVLANPDGRLDDLLTYGWDGREVVIKYSPDATASYGSFTTVFKGTAKDIVAGENEISIVLRDKSELLAKPIQTNKYTGAGGSGGTSDLTDKPKPLLYGTCYSVEPVLVDPVKLIYQFNDGAIATGGGLYDMGVALTYNGSDVANYAALDAISSITPGQYALCSAQGYVRLGAPPAGLLVGDIIASGVTVRDIIYSILTTKAGIVDADINLTSLSQFETDSNWEAGYFLREPDVEISNVIEELVGSVYGFWFYGQDSKINFGVFKFNTPQALTIRQKDIQVIKREPTETPAYTVDVNYQRVWAVHDASDIAFGSQLVQGFLTNESHTVVADSDGTVSDFSAAGGTFKMYEMATDITTGFGVTYSVHSESGVDVSINSSTGVYTVNSMSANQGTAVFRATYGSFIIDATYSIAKAIGGVDAKTIILYSDRQVITYNQIGAVNPSTQTTIFGFNRQNVTGNTTISLFRADGTVINANTYISTSGGSVSASGNDLIISDATTISMTAANFNTATSTTQGVIVQAVQDGATDKISIVKVQKGATGGNSWTPVYNAAEIRDDGGGNFFCLSPGYIHSLQKFTGGAEVTAGADTAGLELAFGLHSSTTPTPSVSWWVSINYSWHLNGSTAIVVINTNNIGTPTTSYNTTTDRLTVRYRGSKIQWLKNEAVIHELTVGEGLQLHMLARVSNAGLTMTGTTFSTVGASGSGAWTPILGNVTQSGGTFTKTSGTHGSFDAQVYSTEKFAQAKVSAMAIGTNGGSGTTGYTMIGLNEDPATDADFNSLDYAVYFNEAAALHAFRNGSNVGAIGTYTTSDVLSVEHIGRRVYIKKNGEIIFDFMVAAAAEISETKELHLDSSFNSNVQGLTNVSFSKAGAEGAGTWTPVYQSAGITKVGSTVTSTGSGGGSYTVRLYSAEKYPGMAVSFKPSQTNANFFVGLDDNPSAVAGYTTLAYSILIASNGNAYVYNNNLEILTMGAYTTSDVFGVEHRGNTIVALKNGAVTHTFTGIDTNSSWSTHVLFDSTGSVNSVTVSKAAAHGQKPDLRFKRSASAPSTPTGDDPSGWTDEIPAGTDALWVSRANRYYNGNLIGTWSTPQLIAGNINPTPWNSSTTYYTYQTVTHLGGTYIASQDNTNQEPSGTAQSTAYWDVIAAPGQEGTPGGGPPGTFTATITVPAGSGQQNLRTLADANGYTGLGAATVTYNVNGTVRGAAGQHGIKTGTWPSGSHTISLTLNVNSGGIVDGGGGNGGQGNSSSGGAGGDGIHCEENLTIVNSGNIRGGGGGGGGGITRTGDLNGDPWQYGGGGGGGGAPNGSGGLGGGQTGTPGDNGSAGTTSGGGAGGAGAVDPLGPDGTAGGAGGTFATNGTTSGGSGGTAGFAVRKNGKTVTNSHGTFSGSWS